MKVIDIIEILLELENPTKFTLKTREEAVTALCRLITANAQVVADD